MNPSLIHFLAHKAYLIRKYSIIMTTEAGSGHPTSALSAADIMAVLFFYVMDFDPHNPNNPSNDRFILSKGHASPALYAVYKELGVVSEADLKQYRDFDSPLEGHPTPRFAWTEAATGSLGQGLSVGIGMALNARMDKKGYYTYVLLGDSEMAEGSVWEALEYAGYAKLHNLVAIIDVNRLGQTGSTMQGHNVDDFVRKFEAFGWKALTVYGHDISALMNSFDVAKKLQDKPVVIIAKTYKGFGLDIEDQEGYHGKAFTHEQAKKILESMSDRFAQRFQKSDFAWSPRLPQTSFDQPTSEHKALPAPSFVRNQLIETRKAFGLALVALGQMKSEIVCLDAEVKNSTYTDLFAHEFPERFIQTFIAEQNMVGIATGLQKRGKIPFAATFSAFFARAFDQLRMAAIGGNALRLCGSHAGVSIGQDGPSQMGLEDIALMRLLPNSIIFYPSDAVSCWKMVALMANYQSGISYIRTTRMATPVIYDVNETFEIGGFKVVRTSKADHVCLIAAGVTLFQALVAHEELKKEGIYVSVVDLYGIKPLNVPGIEETIARAGRKAIVIEDHYQAGGIGEALAAELINKNIIIERLFVNKMPRSGTPECLLQYEEIDTFAIISLVKKVLEV